MLSRVFAATAAVAGANALNACVWLGNDQCPAGASFICKDMPDGECVEVLGIPGTTIYGKFDNNGDGTANVGVYLNSPDCTSGDITDDAIRNNYPFVPQGECTAAATVAGQTAYIATTGTFGDTPAVTDNTNTNTDNTDNANEADNEEPEVVTPPADGGAGGAGGFGSIQAILGLLTTSGLPQNFIDVFRDVIGEDPDRVAEFLRELSADVDVAGLLAVFSDLPDLSGGGGGGGSGGLPTIPAFVAPFASGLKANIRQQFTQDILDALAASTVTNLLTNCGGFFALYGARSLIGREIAGTDFGSQVEGILGVDPSQQRCDDSDITDLLPCTVGFIRSDVPVCSVDVCCATADTITNVPIVAQIIGEIITRVLTDLIMPVLESAVPYIRGGLASLENAAGGEFNVLTNCGLVFHYADTLMIKGLKCKHKKDLDKLQPCATKDNLVDDEPWGRCGPKECCGEGKEQSGIGRTITAFIAYEEAKQLELLAQQLKIVLTAALKTNIASGKFLITCRQWKNFLGGRCKMGQDRVDLDYFCSTYSCFSFGVHKCSQSICCGNASEGWVGAVLQVGITAGQLYEIAQIGLAADPFASQWVLTCGKYDEQFGVKCPGGKKVDKAMPCTVSTFEKKSQIYKCTTHNCCGKFSKKYTPASAFESALEQADQAADVLYAISLSNVKGLFTSGLYTDVQVAVNCETWAAIPGWGYEKSANCTPISFLEYDVSCPNLAPKKSNFQPLAPCRSLIVDSQGNDLNNAIPPCEQACYNRGQEKKQFSGTITASQSFAYPVQLIYLITHMISDPVKAKSIALLLSSFAKFVTGEASGSPALDLQELLKALGPHALPPNIGDILAGNVSLSNPLELLAALAPFIPFLPLDGILFNCGAWAANLDMNYFGRGTCPTGRPVDHDLPCWVPSLNRQVDKETKQPLQGFGEMFFVNKLPNVGDCTPQYCCACRTKAAYSTAEARLLGAAGANIGSTVIKSIITPLIFRLARSLTVFFTDLGFGPNDIYMPQTGYGSDAVLLPPVVNFPIGAVVISNQFCVKHSPFPNGTLPSATTNGTVTFVNGTAGSPCRYHFGEMKMDMKMDMMKH